MQLDTTLACLAIQLLHDTEQQTKQLLDMALQQNQLLLMQHQQQQALLAHHVQTIHQLEAELRVYRSAFGLVHTN